MSRIKDIPKIDRPRERFLEKGPDALSKSELLAILIGSGIKGKNVKQLSEQIIRKFGDKFLDITEELGPKGNIVLSAQDAVSLTSEIDFEEIEKKIDLLNNLEADNDNYFSEHFGNTYFTLENARKIGAIREKSDAYHLLENLVTWAKPSVYGKAKKMDRSHIKSDFCLKSAPKAFADLIFNYN